MLCGICNSPFLCPECQDSFYDAKEPLTGVEFIATPVSKVCISSGEDATMDLMTYLKSSKQGEDPTASYVGQ